MGRYESIDKKGVVSSQHQQYAKVQKQQQTYTPYENVSDTNP